MLSTNCPLDAVYYALLNRSDFAEELLECQGLLTFHNEP